MDRGTGSLIIDSDSQVIFTTPTFTVNNAANSETMITASEDGAVKLYHNNTKMLETFDLGIDLGTSATGNFGIRWGGANYNYANIWTEYGSGDIFIAGGLKQKTTNGGFYSSYGGNFSRNAIQVNAFGNSGIQFYASAPQNVAKDGAITVNEIARINQHGLTFGGESAETSALDDYEEGSLTWASNSTSNGWPTNFTIGNQNNSYTKIGNTVLLKGGFTIANSSGTVAQGNYFDFDDSSLPFTVINKGAGTETVQTIGRFFIYQVLGSNVNASGDVVLVHGQYLRFFVTFTTNPNRTNTGGITYFISIQLLNNLLLDII